MARLICAAVSNQTLSKTEILPLSAYLIPAITFKIVVLPEPESPNKALKLPFFKEKSTSI